MSKSMLPEHPALAHDDSMLTRRFGKEVINYYAGSRLNRYSFLRSDLTFLRKAVSSPLTQFLALNDLNPFIVDSTKLAFFNFDDVKSLIGPDPFGQTSEEKLKAFNSTQPKPLLLFLGLLPYVPEAVEIPTSKHGVVKGQPFFVVDTTPRAPYTEAAEAFIKESEAKSLTIQTNVRGMTLYPEAAALYAQSRSLLDWNARNIFCAGCGNLNLSTEAGYKRVCPPTDLKGGSEPQARGDCPTRHGISNICFPRSDPTMIAAVVSADGQRVLLGRQSRWPPKWYSTLAGFLEPGESIEDAVRREVWEESGVRVGRVVIHSSQPWPYPASLMIGAIAQASPDGEAIDLLDKELEDAKWFTIDEAQEALKSGTSSLSDPAPAGFTGSLRLPPPQAIANRLITAVVEGYLMVAPKI